MNRAWPLCGPEGRQTPAVPGQGVQHRAQRKTETPWFLFRGGVYGGAGGWQLPCVPSFVHFSGFALPVLESGQPVGDVTLALGEDHPV